MLKKTILAVLGLSVSGFAAAGSMGPVCTPGNVTVPCETRLWELGADALYLQSIYGADKAYQLRTNSVTERTETARVANDWNWGYRLTGAYHFNTGNDVTVSWMHFSTSAQKANLTGFDAAAIGIPGLRRLLNELIDRNRLDQVNLVMGQHIDLSIRDKMRAYAGVQYANIQSTAQNYLSGPFTLFTTISGTAITTASVFDNTDFKGFGPTWGLDYSYALIDGLSVTANGAASVLWGTSRYHSGLVFNEAGIVGQAYASKKAIIPSLEAKLGLNYAHALGNGVVNIDAGYQVVNYFGPLQTLASSPAPLATNLLAGSTNAISSVNYGAYGPYFGMKYVGNV